jgi:uncharacterized protein YjcR
LYVVQSNQFRSKVLNEIAAKYDVHPSQISLWKNESVRDARSVFTAPGQLTREIEQLNAKIENRLRIIGESISKAEGGKNKLVYLYR